MAMGPAGAVRKTGRMLPGGEIRPVAEIRYFFAAACLA